MAPEVLRCPFKSRPEENKDNERLHYGARVDAWAVGVLTYELLVGFPPFFDQSRTGTEERIVTKSPEYPTTLSEEAKAYIARALHKNAAERPTILEMLQHPWVDQYRARRSMRTIPTSSMTSGPTTASAAAAPASPAVAVAKARAVATSTNIITAQGAVQAAMAAAPHHPHHPAAYPAHMHSILSSITEDASQDTTMPPMPSKAAVIKQAILSPMVSAVRPFTSALSPSLSPLARSSGEDDASVFMNVTATSVPPAPIDSATSWLNPAPSKVKAPAPQVMARYAAAPAEQR